MLLYTLQDDLELVPSSHEEKKASPVPSTAQEVDIERVPCADQQNERIPDSSPVLEDGAGSEEASVQSAQENEVSSTPLPTEGQDEEIFAHIPAVTVGEEVPDPLQGAQEDVVVVDPTIAGLEVENMGDQMEEQQEVEDMEMEERSNAPTQKIEEDSSAPQPEDIRADPPASQSYDQFDHIFHYIKKGVFLDDIPMYKRSGIRKAASKFTIRSTNNYSFFFLSSIC